MIRKLIILAVIPFALALVGCGASDVSAEGAGDKAAEIKKQNEALEGQPRPNPQDSGQN
jgi:hypothetical protein